MNEELKELLSGEEGVARVFSRYSEQLRRMIRFRLDKRLFARVDCDGILQDTYMEIARRINDYTSKPTVPFFVWARQIATQNLIDTHRTHLGAKMRNANLEVSLHKPGFGHATSYSLAAQLIGNLTSPSRAAVREERIEELRDGLQTMDDIDREVLVLRHLEELSNNEVAEILGLEKSAASKRYVRALKRLKEVMTSLASKSSQSGMEHD